MSTKLANFILVIYRENCQSLKNIYSPPVILAHMGIFNHMGGCGNSH